MTRSRSLSVGTNNGNVMTGFGKGVGEGANTECENPVVVADEQFHEVVSSNVAAKMKVVVRFYLDAWAANVVVLRRCRLAGFRVALMLSEALGIS